MRTFHGCLQARQVADAIAHNNSCKTLKLCYDRTFDSLVSRCNWISSPKDYITFAVARHKLASHAP